MLYSAFRLEARLQQRPGAPQAVARLSQLDGHIQRFVFTGTGV